MGCGCAQTGFVAARGSNGTLHRDKKDKARGSSRVEALLGQQHQGRGSSGQQRNSDAPSLVPRGWRCAEQACFGPSSEVPIWDISQGVKANVMSFNLRVMLCAPCVATAYPASVQGL
eukprot:5405775-Pleurochrysis_carterae.AAC.1